MKLTPADRRMAAVITAALAVMLLCFVQRGSRIRTLTPLPWAPPQAAEDAPGGRVNVNTAGLEELTALPGIGETRARAILDDREANGPFLRPEDLIRVRGIGEGTLEGILDLITTEACGEAGEAAG